MASGYVFLFNMKGMLRMRTFTAHIIKSFKHDGRLHRLWFENWRVPLELLVTEHSEQEIIVFVNNQTRIQEADGSIWVSKLPAVSFFIPGEWYNIVALLEGTGIRYYCNIASPYYLSSNVLTYIDYDLDVILESNGHTYILDLDEYERHKFSYQYSTLVDQKVKVGLGNLKLRIHNKVAPFNDHHVLTYYQHWKDQHI